ncbi:hypothetical protein EGW08_011982, partial [Elysia chlorotica]
SSVTDCLPCPSRKYCPQGSSTDGLDCPAGFFCTATQESGFQNACPIGTFSSNMGLENGTECEPCPAGFYCPAGSQAEPTVAPVSCPPGSYNPLPMTGHPTNCIKCDPGFACPQYNQTASVMPCKEGHYCPEGTLQDDQFPCLPGTYTGATNLTSSNECDPCPERFYCDFGTGVTISPPQPCGLGHYCPLMTPAVDRYPCEPGTFTSRSDLKMQSECSICTQGYYCIGGQAAETDVCPPGYYCPNGTAHWSDYGCPNGTYNPTYGMWEEGQCLNCTQGHYCEFAVTVPQDCPVGTYMPYGVDGSNNLIGEPAEGSESCLECPGGSYCTAQTIFPYDCNIGFYSEPGQYECLVCKAGYYCDNATTSEDDMLNNKKCTAGKFCTDGLSDLSQATDCTIGKYCPEATPEELLCPVGTKRETVGAAAVTDCAPCDAGYYCVEGSTDETGPCSKGFYCPTNFANPYAATPATIGSYGAEQEPCPAGTYMDEIAAPNLTSCKTCPTGYYCPQASVNPTDCPQGSYCPIQSGVPTPCPAGRYGNRTHLETLTDCNLCDPGYYCDTQGLLLPRAQCDPGYLCYSGAVTSGPIDGITGELCPA